MCVACYRSREFVCAAARLTCMAVGAVRQWESNNVVEAVVIKSNLDEFFCRGGDVKYLHACAKDPSLRREVSSTTTLYASVCPSGGCYHALTSGVTFNRR